MHQEQKGQAKHHDGFRYQIYGNEDGVPSVAFPPEKLQYVWEHGHGQFIVPAFGLGSICRLVLKMGYEFLAHSQQADIWSSDFDAVRRAIRFPPRGQVWPLAFGCVQPQDLAESGHHNRGQRGTRTVYNYFLGCSDTDSTYLFHFVFYYNQFAVPLRPDGDFNKLVDRFNESQTAENVLRIESVQLLDEFGQSLSMPP